MSGLDNLSCFLAGMCAGAVLIMLIVVLTKKQLIRDYQKKIQKISDDMLEKQKKRIWEKML